MSSNQGDMYRQTSYISSSTSRGNNGGQSAPPTHPNPPTGTHTLQNPPTYWAPALPPNPAQVTPDNRRKTKKVVMPLRLHPNGNRRIAIHEVMGVYNHPEPIPMQAYENACGSWSITQDTLVTPEEVYKALQDWGARRPRE